MRFRIPLFCWLLFITVSAQAQLPVGTQAPSIRLPDVSGKTITLESLSGQWILIDFWASWCGPCRLSNRAARKFYEDWKTKGLEVLSVSLDANRADWLKAIKQDKLQWLQVNSPAQWDSPLVLSWQVDRIPTTYLLDPNGVIQAVNPPLHSIASLLSRK